MTLPLTHKSSRPRPSPSHHSLPYRPHQAPSSSNPYSSLINRMAQPTTFRPEWFHSPHYQQVRRSKLWDILYTQLQEFDDGVMPEKESRIKSEDEYISPFRGLSVSHDIKFIGAEFSVRWLAGCTNTRSQYVPQHETFVLPPDSLATQDPLIGYPASGRPPSGNTFNPGLVAYPVSVRSFGNNITSNGSSSQPSNQGGSSFGQRSVHSQLGAIPSTRVSKPKQNLGLRPREYPDLFYAYDRVLYQIYRGECSRHYSDFRAFMRHGLEKHLHEIHVHGISPETLRRAGLVPHGLHRQRMTEQKKEQWYRSARQMLFGTPYEEEIAECEDSGYHDLARGQRTYHRRATGSTSGSRARTIANQDAAIAPTTVATQNFPTDPSVSSMIEFQSGNINMDGQIHSLPNQQQSLANSNHNRTSFAPTHFEPPSRPQLGSVSDTASLAIQRIHINLVLAHQAIHAGSQSSRTQSVPHLLEEFLRDIENRTSQFAITARQGLDAHRQPIPQSSMIAATDGYLHPQWTNSNGDWSTSGNSVLTPGESTGQASYTTDNNNFSQQNYPFHGP